MMMMIIIIVIIIISNKEINRKYKVNFMNLKLIMKTIINKIYKNKIVKRVKIYNRNMNSYHKILKEQI